VACEAVRNAFNHAHASRIEVEIHYDKRRFRVRVRDDGKGIDPQVLEEGRRAGHFGLPGMQERAELAGGELAVWSEPDSGTEIELTIPAAVAYSKPSAPGRRQVVHPRHRSGR
jgi:signal transduction histidine kinase